VLKRIIVVALIAGGTAEQAFRDHRSGLVHWTHKDPQGTHEPGWIEFAGRRFD
jgi:hypothetical protein